VYLENFSVAVEIQYLDNITKKIIFAPVEGWEGWEGWEDWEGWEWWDKWEEWECEPHWQRCGAGREFWILNWENGGGTFFL